MENWISYLIYAIHHPFFILISITISLSIKAYVLRILAPYGLHTTITYKPWLYLLGILVGSLFGDLAWIIKLLRALYFHEIPYTFLVFLIRISWAFLIVQYQSIALFTESITEKNFMLRATHKILLSISSTFFFYFIYIAFFETKLINEVERGLAWSQGPETNVALEVCVMQYVTIYLLTLVTTPAVYYLLKKVRHNPLPKIMQRQLKTFCIYLVMPYFFVEVLQAISSIYQPTQAYLYPIVSLSTLLLAFALHYCIRKVLQLRFLNIAPHVQSTSQLHCIQSFKGGLEQLAHATNMTELKHITQTFFKETFHVPLYATSLNIREMCILPNKSEFASRATHGITFLVEQCVTMHEQAIMQYMHHTPVLIYDEIEFNHFYNNTPETTLLLGMLDALDADIFIPLYKRNTIIAYIIVTRNARLHECYDIIERDKMMLFGNYLAAVVHLLQTKDTETFVLRERKLHQLVEKQQREIEITHEGIRSFIQPDQQEKVGVMCYKNNRFVFGNHAAKKQIPLNVNIHVGHPLTKALKDIAHHVETYKTPHTIQTYDINRKPLILSAAPYLAGDQVIITITPPDITDIIYSTAKQLNNPNDWPTVLHLERTKAGKILHKITPSNTRSFLTFKISLLHAGLSKKPVLINAPDADLPAIASGIHHISKRDTCHTLTITPEHKQIDVAITLFGVSPTMGVSNQITKRPLLEKLHKTGTLFIQNVDLLDEEIHNYLVEYSSTGLFRAFKGNQRIPSDVRLIFSTSMPIKELQQKGLFSRPLHHLLEDVCTMPPLATIDEDELYALADGFVEQDIQNDTFKNLLVLSPKDKARLAHQRSTSLHHLKTKVHALLVEKSKKNDIYHETTFDPAYAVTDPDLIQAARLGKHALKNRSVMAMLWYKFKNQNKIAALLDVNRSSVNRRCKEYNLQ